MGEVDWRAKRGRRRFSRRREAAGSRAARVRERKRGSSTRRTVVSASRRMDIEESWVWYSWWAAHWTRRRESSTDGVIWFLRRLLKVRVWSSPRVEGGGVPGGIRSLCLLSVVGLSGLVMKAAEVLLNWKPLFSRADITLPLLCFGTMM